MDKIKLTLGTLTVLVSLAGTLWAVDHTYAHESDLAMLDSRLDTKIRDDRANAIQTKLWQIEDHYTNKDMPSDTRELYRQLQLELRKLQEQQLNGPVER